MAHRHHERGRAKLAAAAAGALRRTLRPGERIELAIESAALPVGRGVLAARALLAGAFVLAAALIATGHWDNPVTGLLLVVAPTYLDRRVSHRCLLVLTNRRLVALPLSRLSRWRVARGREGLWLERAGLRISRARRRSGSFVVAARDAGGGEVVRRLAFPPAWRAEGADLLARLQAGDPARPPLAAARDA